MKRGLDDFLKEHSPEELLKLPRIEYKPLEERIKEEFNSENYHEYLKEIIALYGENEIEQIRLSKLVAKRLNIDYKTVLKQLKKYNIKEEESKENYGDILREYCNLNYTPELPEEFFILNNKLWIELQTKEGAILKEQICDLFGINGIIEHEKPMLWLKKENKETYIPIAISDTKVFDSYISSFLETPHEKATLKLIQRYITRFFDINKDKIPRYKKIDTTGWHEDIFYLPTIQKEDNIIWDNTIKNAIKSKGTLENQKSIIKEILHYPLGIGILASFSAPLLEILNVENFIINISGITGMGKSTSAKAGLSIWGDPEKLKISWWGTKVGFELVFSVWKDMPVWVDEMQFEDKKEISKFVSILYDYFLGIGKIRGTKELSVRPISKFRGIMITTSEHDLDTVLTVTKDMRTKARGLLRRVIEIKAEEDFTQCFLTGKKIDLRKLNRLINETYGLIGQDWINKINENRNIVKEAWDTALQSMSIENITEVESFYAVLFTTALLLNYFYDFNCAYLSYWIRENVITEHKEALTEVKDIVYEFYEILRSTVIENRDKFLGMLGITEEYEIDRKPDFRNIWGRVFDNDVFIISEVFNDLCNKKGLIKKQLLNKLNNNGLLKITKQGDRKHYKYVTKILGKVIWGYYFINVFEEEYKEGEVMKSNDF